MANARGHQVVKSLTLPASKLVAVLTDEQDREVGSEKMVELHWEDGKPVRCGDQFGYGRE